jgi:dienelactone hydrolase
VVVSLLVVLGACAGPRLFRAGAGVEFEFTGLRNDRFENKEKWLKYKGYLAEKLWKMMGDFPVAEGPLNEKTLSRVDRSGYALEKVQFESEPEEIVPAYVLVPKGIQPPYPAVICIHAEGQSKEDIVGETPGATEGGTATRIGRTPHMQFAKRLAEKGYLAIAIDLKGAGERTARDRYMGRPFDWDSATPEARKEAALANLERAAVDELLQGRCWMGRTIWDVKRTMDYLSTRKDIARYRTGFLGYSLKVGCMGYWMGGTVTTFAAAYDDRIRVAVSAGGLSTLDAMSREGANGPLAIYVPGMLRYCDMPDIAGMIAPRQLLVAGGRQDPLHPSEGVEKISADVQKVYQLYGYPENFSVQMESSPYGFSEPTLQNSWAWLEKWF